MRNIFTIKIDTMVNETKTICLILQLITAITITVL